MTASIDILMITHERPEYTRLSLAGLLDSCDDRMRVWVWHNGSDAETLGVVHSMQEHPRFHRLHHSPDNRLIREPINWLFDEADGDLLGLVNDDCVVTDGWAHTLRSAHEDVAELGVIACWHFRPEDYVEHLARRKTRTFSGGHRLMVNPWVQGSGVVLKRSCVRQLGLLAPRELGFTPYCIRLAHRGWINGWYLPLIPLDHLDDPRSPRTLLRSDIDLATRTPLSARHRGARSIGEWDWHLRRSARAIQEAPSDPRLYVGLRKKIRRSWTRLMGRELLY